MSRNKHRSRLLAEAKAKGLCRPPPKPGGAERHRQHQINTHAKYVRRAWLQVVRDDKVSYRQRMDAQLAHREAEHQSAIADLRCQLASAQIAAERMKADRTVTVSGPTANRDLQDPGSQGCFTIKFY
jgi:hypothetical protein